MLDFFGWPAPKTAGAQRGGEAVPFTALNVWVLDRRDGRMHQITSDGYYRSPLYHPNGQRLLALHKQSLVELDAGHGGGSSERRWIADLESSKPAYLLGLMHDKLGFLTEENDLLIYDFKTEKTRALEKNLPQKVKLQVERASRRCQTGEILSSPLRKGLRGLDVHAADVLVRRDEPGAAALNLTEALETRVHLDPAWSPDCRRIAFIASPG